MTVTIGWFGRDPHMVDGVAEVADDTGTLRLSGRVPHTDPVMLAVLHRQLVGLAENRVPQPVTVGSMPHVDGFYVVESVQVQVPPGRACSGWWPWSVVLRPVESRHAPLVESTLVGLTRSNTESVMNPTRWHAVPASTQRWGIRPPSVVVGVDVQRVPTVDGDLDVRSGWLASQATAQWQPTLDSVMVGAARLHVGDIAEAPGAVFGPSSSLQSYTVPVGVTMLRVDLGGAPGYYAGFVPWPGGRGGRVLADLAVTPEETLTIQVGRTPRFGDPAWFDGGPGGTTDAPGIRVAGSGGDSTRIMRGSTVLAIAGGGGGSGGSGTGQRFLGGHSGQYGQPGATGTDPTLSGRGADWTNPGNAGTGDGVAAATPGQPGLGHQGGAGGNSTVEGPAGGGGGGGYLGGGGGAGRNLPGQIRAGAGGGGSSWAEHDDVTNAAYSVRSDHLIDGYARIHPAGDTQPPNIARHIHTGGDLPQQPHGWVLENGIVGCAPAFDGSRFGLWAAPAAGDPAAARLWWLTDSTDTPLTARIASASISSVAVLRATNEATIVRINLAYTTFTYGPVGATATLTLRRGAPVVEVTIETVGVPTWGIGCDTTDPVTTGDGYLTDGDAILLHTHGTQPGNELAVTTPQGSTATFAIGHQHPPYTTETTRDMWYAALTETQRIVRP